MTGRRVLFLCTGNSSRSQMAEGLMRAGWGQQYTVLSAGVRPAGMVHPEAVAVLLELGIDISRQRSKSIAEFLPPAGQPPELIIALCAAAADSCPEFPDAVSRWHWPLADPFHAPGSPEDRRQAYRDTRDALLARLEEAFGPPSELPVAHRRTPESEPIRGDQ